jgi:D-3-phosphoglycerate dehydrogenase / 2-oxoglutarate reductase
MNTVLLIDKTHPLLIERLLNQGYQCEEFQGKSLQDLLNLGDRFSGFIIRSRFKLDEKVFHHFPSLKFIGRSGSGMESIDIEAARRRGIRCYNSPEGNRDAVAEHAVGMLLNLLNRIARADAEMRKGIWRREENRGRELRGLCIALLGYGNTGMAFAQRLRGFGVDVLAYDRYKHGFSDQWVRESNLDDIFSRADVLSLHLPLTAETHHMINSHFIARFEKSIYLLNTSRGPVVDTAALVQALKAGKIIGAALDVHEFEKASFEGIEAGVNQQLMEFLRKSPDVLLTPHIAGWTIESEIRLAEILADKIGPAIGYDIS